jgi:hypothetical protein
LDSTYHVSNHAGDFVNFNFSGAFTSSATLHPSVPLTAPSRPLSLGSAVTVFGLRDVSSGNFSVQLDNDSVTLNGASSSEVATTLFFRTGLDNTIPHSLTITNEADGLLVIGLINVTTATSTL